jgi:hypothetical protein
MVPLRLTRLFNSNDKDLNEVGKGKGLGDGELSALKKDTAWENRFNDNGEAGVAKNDHGPWHRKLNNTMFWLGVVGWWERGSWYGEFGKMSWVSFYVVFGFFSLSFGVVHSVHCCCCCCCFAHVFPHSFLLGFLFAGFSSPNSFCCLSALLFPRRLAPIDDMHLLPLSERIGGESTQAALKGNDTPTNGRLVV